MKAWTVYLVNGEKRVSVFTSGADGEELIKSVYGDVSVEWIGWERCEEYDKRLYVGMTRMDSIIASRILKSKAMKELGLMG